MQATTPRASGPPPITDPSLSAPMPLRRFGWTRLPTRRPRPPSSAHDGWSRHTTRTLGAFRPPRSWCGRGGATPLAAESPRTGGTRRGTSLAGCRRPGAEGNRGLVPHHRLRGDQSVVREPLPLAAHQSRRDQSRRELTPASTLPAPRMHQAVSAPQELGWHAVPVQVHLLDGTYELFRQFFGQPPRVAQDGAEVGATRGVLQSVLRMLADGATHVGVATDHVIESFRNELWPSYKNGESVPPELKAQFGLLEDGLDALGVTVWPMVELEADDALASAAAVAAADRKVEQILLCTPDKDLAQCVVTSRVVQVDPRRG